MTIKRQLFYFSIRILLVAICGLIVSFLTIQVVASLVFRVWESGGNAGIESFRRLYWLLSPVSFAVFIAFFGICNSKLSRRITTKITGPLDILSVGVREIQENNFAYRIEYNGNDEFRPVCEAFNHMAARLEASTEQRLKDEANRRELLAGISHDLRTPLTAINGYLDGLESGVASTPEMREKYIGTIKNNTASMKHIIEQLFLFSKLDMDEFSFSPRRFDIMRALSDMIEELAEEYAMKGLVIKIAGSPENVFVRADAAQLRRVLVNILENSAKYKEKETGRVEISASIDNDFVRLVFADDGPGVSPEALPKLFNVFYRADPSRHTKGSGLGLAISAKVIERSGGTISAANGDSGGFVVVIRLPIETGEE
ncbi:MAG: HAMP domain-containing histidine kinase [Treponema sp.]|jgi:signal transduction histidine kinase|nr:HAMP domain-containing histidine kinase [Treponema sp.]